MLYTVIEKFSDTDIQIAHKDGKPAIFDDLEEAEEFASEVQDGIVVPLVGVKQLYRAIIRKVERQIEEVTEEILKEI